MIDIPIMRPWLPEFKEVEPMFREVLESGLITNGKYVAAFERRVAEYLGAKHCVAVSSGTNGTWTTFATDATRFFRVVREF